MLKFNTDAILNKIRKNTLVSSKYQTKDWRKKQNWYCNGKKNECEKYQEKTLRDIKLDINKNEANNFRLNLITNSIVNVHSLKKQLTNWCDVSFEYSENFDFMLENEKNIYLFNLKFICGSGGIQIRSLKEVYHFINSQYQCECLINDKKIVFINLLDGDFCYNNKNKFSYLSSLYKHKNNVHILDTYTFINKSSTILKIV